jgi:hypothetical protein
VTKKNTQIAKYRIWGLVIILVALFGFAFSVLLLQEQSQLASIYQFQQLKTK